MSTDGSDESLKLETTMQINLIVVGRPLELGYFEFYNMFEMKHGSADGDRSRPQSTRITSFVLLISSRWE